MTTPQHRHRHVFRLTLKLLSPGLLVAAVSIGCMAGKGYQPPQTALRQYAVALSEGRIEDAHALLSSDARTRLSLDDFRRMVASNPSEISDITAQLLDPDSVTEITAEVQGPEGSTLHLVYEQNAWRISASTLDLYAQHTPQLAISSFLRAYENRRYDILLEFVPDEQRLELTGEQLKQAWEGEQKLQIERLTQALKASLPDLKVEVIGPRATVGYGAGGTVELVNEHGLWKIEDI